MMFLVELDHVKTTAPTTPAAGREFIERVIFPTLARAEQLVAEGKIVAGGVVAGRIALRFVVEADSTAEADQIVSSLPVWVVAESHVTPLIAFGERRAHVQRLLDKLTHSG
jgi:muconolactone delta-isomerase